METITPTIIKQVVSAQSLIEFSFLDSQCKQHNISVSFDKGQFDLYTNSALMEDLSVAVMLTVEKFFKSKLIASNCQMGTFRDGEFYKISEWLSPKIYNNELFQKYKVG